jgi:hypothetical protein
MLENATFQAGAALVVVRTYTGAGFVYGYGTEF